MEKIQIHGKDYIPVNERVKEFHKLYKNGSISAEVIGGVNGSALIKVTVVPDISEPTRVFTGFGYETKDNTFINSKNFVENCETSAVGRALGFLGIGIDTSIASADEVNNAINNQPEPEEKITKDEPIEEKTEEYVDHTEDKPMTDEEKRDEIEKIIILLGGTDIDVDQEVIDMSSFKAEDGKFVRGRKLSQLKGKWLNVTLGRFREKLQAQESQ